VSLLTTLFGQLPQILVCIVAIVLAVSRWNRHPQASMLVTLGATLELGAALGSMVMLTALREQLVSLSLVFTLMHLVAVAGFGLIVASVFVERGPA
jgi:hypothetical protein